MVTASRLTPAQERAEIEQAWDLWLLRLFRPYLVNKQDQVVPFADHHREFWEWIWQVRRGVTPQDRFGRPKDAFVGVWPRGGAKSTSIELAGAMLAARKRRKYALYVSGTQDQANDHVANVGGMLTRPDVLRLYPDSAQRGVSEYGPKAWRRNRVQTEHFTCDAMGLDTAMRGAKIDEDRPDLIIIDDIDAENDSSYLTSRKIKTITRALLPARSEDAIVVAVQNLILRNGVFDQLVTGKADYLTNRIVSGPHPAIHGLVTEPKIPGPGYKIVGGRPSWVGQDIEACQKMIDVFGLQAFIAECQHELERTSDLVHPQFNRGTHRWSKEMPKFRRVVGGLDFGGEGLTANESAGLVAGEMPDRRLLLLSEFKDNGPDVGARHEKWMLEQEMRWKGPGSIEWAGDKTEILGLQLLRRDGFNVRASGRPIGDKTNSREARIRLCGTRLALDSNGIPGIFYTDGVPEWVTEIEGYRREPIKFEGDTGRRKVLTVNDHLMTAWEYMVEMVDAENRPVDTNEMLYSEIRW